MKKSRLVSVVFEPDGTQIMVPAGTLLSKAAAAAGKAIEMPCGGMGTCGKCKVTVVGAVSEPDAVERQRLSDEDIAAGVRLACRTRVAGDMAVNIPDTSRSLVQKILSHGVLRDCAVMSGVSKACCELSPPSLEDERAEFERLADHLSAHDITLKPNPNVIRTLSADMRAADYKLTAVTWGDELIAVEPGDTTAVCCGIAYDLGSTTIVGYLMDLVTGEQLAVSAQMNPQMIYGDDLVARISFATTEKNGAAILQSAVVDAMNRIADDVAQMAEITTDRIYKAVVVGNPCMTHLLMGIGVRSLGQSPYVPSVCSDLCLRARELSLDFSPEAPVAVLPNVAGFVGSDLVAVLLASSWQDDGRTRLVVDIGTNGEMALIHNGKTYACSAAAGPAFEGAGISCGMRGAPGAIDGVTIGGSVRVSTIEDRPPVGICGSGLVDAVAQMLDAGIVDETGRLLSSAEAGHLSPQVAGRLVETQNGVEFVLATSDESGNGKPVTLTHSDIRRLQLAKGSIHAAVQTLLQTAGTSDDELSEILLSGAFGNYIRVESAIRIGLIPPVSTEVVGSVGNAAGAGARLALLSEQEMDQARKLAKSAMHLELAVSPNYQMELMERIMFPSELAAT